MTKAEIIDGKAMALEVREEVGKKVAILKDKHGLTPGLAVVLVGDNPASQIYVRNKGKATVASGMNSFEHKFDADLSEADLLKLIADLNNDEKVSGILVQMPLPKHIDEAKVIEAISPEKDVDGFHVINAGLLATGGTGMVPCSPLGCLLMLKKYVGSLSGKAALVIGRSNIVGKPMAQLLLKESCTVTIAHSRTKDLKEECLRSDIIVAAVGVAHLVTADMVKPGTVVIDVGQNVIPAPEKGEGGTRLVGDVDYGPVSEVASSITPVPGGVGPMTIACLLRNTVTAACRQNGIDEADLN
jgi:methylenetetrahydrofolate dehydrogenase (NADP+)/methenyltetrahydrofolate cyclohydrolase